MHSHKRTCCAVETPDSPKKHNGQPGKAQPAKMSAAEERELVARVEKRISRMPLFDEIEKPAKKERLRGGTGLVAERINREISKRTNGGKGIDAKDSDALEGVLEFTGQLEARAAKQSKKGARSDRDAVRQFERMKKILDNFTSQVKNGRHMEQFTRLNSIRGSGNAGDELMDAILSLSKKAGWEDLIVGMRLFDILAQNMPSDARVRSLAIDVIIPDKNLSPKLKPKVLSLLYRVNECDGFCDDIVRRINRIWAKPSEDAYWETYVFEKLLDHPWYSHGMLQEVMKAVETSPYSPRWRLELLLSAMDNPAFSRTLVTEQGLLGSICRLADVMQQKKPSIKEELFFSLKCHLDKCTPLNAAYVDALAGKASNADSRLAVNAIFEAQKKGP